jgi:UDP-glucuronate decarboxylase
MKKTRSPSRAHSLEIDGRVASNFIMQALKDEPITVYGEGRQTRSFCYVDDLSEGSVRLMASPEVTGPISLGNPCEFTIKELTEVIIAITGSKSKLISLPLPQDDPKQRKPDITPANRHLGWKPLVPLREGLQHTIAYFEALLTSGRVETSWPRVRDHVAA